MKSMIADKNQKGKRKKDQKMDITDICKKLNIYVNVDVDDITSRSFTCNYYHKY